ncbi:MAG: cation-translocating P-type ATPase [Chloroflexi bacterium]|nr:cation-translocating P-type ATPase [Chloroflexota bacterium]
MSETAWHTMPPHEVLSQLQTDPENGLAKSEVTQRLAQYGPNELVEAERPGFWRQLLNQFNNFVIYILLFAAVVSFVLGDEIEAIAIMAIVILNATLGVVQEGRAEQALSALKKLAAPNAKVIREGHTESISASELVPGDMVLLEAGDYIPADLRLVTTINLSIEEASLTGESVPVSKKAEQMASESDVIGDRLNMAYMGTIATYGRGKGVVTGTGMKTEIGKIADALQSTEEEETPLQRRLDELGKTLSISALIICGLVFIVGAIQDLRKGLELVDSLQESFIIAISLAIAAVPEGLPAVVTINLAIGMREMIRRNALIRRLPAVETLGSATAICSDKTGTLTQNQMTAAKLYVAGYYLDVTGEGYAVHGDFRLEKDIQKPDERVEIMQLLLGGLLASDARLEKDINSPTGYRMIGDPTEGALVVAAAKAGVWRTDAENTNPRVAEIPFDADRKRMSTIHKMPDGQFLAFVKGAPDILIAQCNSIFENGQAVVITPERRQNILNVNAQLAAAAFRVLAVAQKRLGPTIPTEITPDTIETDMELIGLVALLDPARPEVGAAIARARNAGIRTVMVTGDYADTARAIAKEIGLLRPGGEVISGAELEKMSDAELDRKVDTADAFARVSPAHKVRIVEAFRRRNHIVAMTGDGVNDAPALKRASIGVAMGITGTDVSKESADMILTDDNYASIVSAVEQGRVIYANIRKFVYFLLSCNLAEICVIFLGTLAGWPTPLTAIQLLWLNLITDGAPALALGVEKGDPDIMDRPPRSPDEPIVNKDMVIGMIIQTIVMTTVTLLAFAIGRGDIHLSFITGTGDALARTMAFVTLSAAQLARAYSSRSELFSIFKIGPLSNKYMQYAVLSSAVGLLLVLYIPFLRDIFDTTLLKGSHWVVLIPLLLFPTVIAELTKPFLLAMHRREEAKTAQ